MLAKVPDHGWLELASHVSTEKEYEMGDASSPVRIAVMDYGCKQHILECMAERGAYVKVFPAKTLLQN